MEKVERKKRSGRAPRRLLWILGGIVLTAVCVFAAVRLNRDEATASLTETPDPRGTITDREPEEIVRLTVRRQDGEAWTAVRDADGILRLEGEEDWIPDENLTDRIMDALANIVYEEVLTENPADYQDRLADFGLADPVLTASAEYTDGSSVTLRFGNASAVGDRDFRYMTVDGDPRLFAAASSLLEDLQPEKELLHPVEQPEIQAERLDRITVRSGTGEILTEWVLEGKITDAGAAERWMLNFPFRYPADFDTMVSLRTNAAGLRLGLWVGKAGETDLALYGLEQPQKILELHLAAGTTGQITPEGIYNPVDRAEETLRFEIGSAKNDLVNYVRYGDTVYTVNRFSLETMTEADPLNTAARYPVTVSLEDLEKLTVERDGRTDVYRLSRESVPAKDEEQEAETIIRCEKNGQEISMTAFEAAYERLLVVTVSGRLPDSFERGETEVRYVFRTLSGTERVLELSPFDDLHDAVTLDGCTVFYLIRGGMTDLP